MKYKQKLIDEQQRLSIYFYERHLRLRAEDYWFADNHKSHGYYAIQYQNLAFMLWINMFVQHPLFSSFPSVSMCMESRRTIATLTW